MEYFFKKIEVCADFVRESMLLCNFCAICEGVENKHSKLLKVHNAFRDSLSEKIVDAR